MQFYSEFGEDEWLYRKGLLPPHGFFMDVGCGDPEGGSNSAAVRKCGWNGVAVDGNPIHQDSWKNTSIPFINAVIAPPDKNHFLIHPNDPGTCRAISQSEADVLRQQTTSPIKPVTAVTLNAVLEHCNFSGEMDLLSLDIEGGEYDALRKFDIEKYRPRIIISEYNTAGIGIDARAFQYLTGTGKYKAIHQTFANMIYQRA